MGINSRSKGNKGERDVAKLMKKWTGKDFARVPSSGGLQWKNAHAKGDIVCSEEGHYFPFCIEVKNYKELNFQHLLYLPEPDILKFWNQCLRDAEICNKAPMLIMRYNGLPKEFYFIAMRPLHYREFIKPYQDENIKVMGIPHLGIIIFTTPALLEVPYKKIRKPLRKFLKTNK